VSDPRPGLRTTELILACVVVVSATVLLALGKLDATAWAAVASVASGAYSWSRGKAKAGVL